MCVCVCVCVCVRAHSKNTPSKVGIEKINSGGVNRGSTVLEGRLSRVPLERCYDARQTVKRNLMMNVNAKSLCIAMAT